MKPPPTASRVIGHPILSGVLMLIGMGFVAICLYHGSVVPAVIVAALLERVMRAQEHERDYRAWKQAWDGMDPTTPARRRPWLLAARTVTVMAVAFYSFTHLRDATVQVGLACIVAALLLGLVVKLARRARLGRPRRAALADPVTIALRGPLLPVPSLPQAYAALPDYCRRLLDGRP